MNRDIVLGSSIVMGAFVLAGTVLVHENNRLKSLQTQSEIASTVDAIVSKQVAQQTQAQQTIEKQFVQEQRFISLEFAQQKIRLEQALAASRNGDSDQVASIDDQSAASGASDQSGQAGQ